MLVIKSGSRRLAYAFALLLAGAGLTGCSGGGDASKNPLSGGSGPTPSGAPTPTPTTVPTPTSTSAPTPTPTPTATPPTSSTDTLLQLGWEPNTEAIAGYVVYYGASAATATNIASTVPVADNGFDPATPRVAYYANRDLGLTPGDPVCFRIRAYFSNDVMSDWSQAACGTI